MIQQVIFSMSEYRHFSTLLAVALLAAALGGCAGPAERREGGQISAQEARTDKADSNLPWPAETEEAEGDLISASEESSPVAEEIRVPMEHRVYFLFDSAVLDEPTRVLLGRYAEYLKQNSRALRLEGHTDERGTREYNLALGQSRVEAVLDYLVLQGISRSRLRGASYGEERPADSGHSEQSWQKNRRVEIILN